MPTLSESENYFVLICAKNKIHHSKCVCFCMQYNNLRTMLQAIYRILFESLNHFTFLLKFFCNLILNNYD